MVVRKPYIFRGLVDLSWDKFNLFNLYRFSKAAPERELNKTAFQLRWRAKQLTIPYHAGHITQRMFRRLRPKILPRVPRPPAMKSLALPVPPTTMLSYAFLERRVDMTIFRACFVQSIWEAHHLCRTGCVQVNGKRVRSAGYTLEDGDIVQLDADRVPLLNTKLRDTSANAKLGEDAPEGQVVDDRVEPDRASRLPFFASKDWGFHPVPYMAPWMFVPEYLEVNYNNMSVCFLRSPTIKPGRCEIPSPYDELTHQRAFDFYSQYRRLK